MYCRILEGPGQENVLVEVDSSVGELAESTALLELGSLLSVLSKKKKGQHFVLQIPSLMVRPRFAGYDRV